MAKFVFACSAAVAASVSPVTHADLFEAFVEEHSRSYASKDERARRFGIFAENMKFVEETNAKQLSYTLGVTQFADLTFEEFQAEFVGGLIPMPDANRTNTVFGKPANFVEPDSIDWVTKGGVSSVKNQGRCGSCWTFSATGALEGAMFAAGRPLVELSQEMLLDCDTGIVGGHACKGGSMPQAFGWVKSHGLCSMADYPYKCADPTTPDCVSSLGNCASKKCTPVLAAGGWFSSGDVTKYTSVTNAVGELEAAVAQQPVSVAIEADTPVFQHYKGGVLTDDACGENLDHGVLAVGYGVDNGVSYWKVKNSWGSTFGEKGYIRIEKGKKEKGGECGIRKMASFPTLASAKHEIIV